MKAPEHVLILKAGIAEIILHGLSCVNISSSGNGMYASTI
jgi:hypothetical protein